MQCEVCGKRIIGKPYRVVIEGARMIACAECARFGSSYWTTRDETRPKKTTLGSLKSVKIAVKNKNFHHQLPSEENIEVIEGFGSIVKSAREKLGLTPEDLGKMIGEKESVIKKIEGEKIIPDTKLAGKLERVLRIKLLIRRSGIDLNGSTGVIVKGKRSITLGEIVEIKDRKKGGSDED
ncbi:MAG: multiprotein bridging factor aMBF1 [Candidatus Bathyarchaeia archaeon]